MSVWGGTVSKESRIRAFGGALLVVLVGIACAFVFSGTLGEVLAFVFIASGLVLATSLVFLEVGLSEDRERERESRREREREGRREREREGRLERERELRRERDGLREREGAGGEAGREAGRPLRLARLRGQRRRLK
jgi:hypothetical protein